MRGELNRLNHLSYHYCQYHFGDDDDGNDDDDYDDDDDDEDDNDHCIDLLLSHLCKHLFARCSSQLGPLIRRSVGCLLIIMILIQGHVQMLTILFIDDSSGLILGSLPRVYVCLFS